MGPTMTTDLKFELSRFAQDHPQGWGHAEWLGLLNDLRNAGHDVSDSDSVGLALEGERLFQTLLRMEVKGLGPKRIQAVVSNFGTLWNLMNATPEEVSLLTKLPRSLAEEVLDILQ